MSKEFPDFTNVIEFPRGEESNSRNQDGVVIPFRTSQSGEVGSSLYEAYKTSLLERRGLDREIAAVTRWLMNNDDRNFSELKPVVDQQIDFLTRYADEKDLPLAPLEGDLLYFPVRPELADTTPEVYEADVLAFNRDERQPEYPPLRLIKSPSE